MAGFHAAEAGETFEPYRPQIYDWAYRLLGSHHDALDIVQDVFLRWLTQVQTSMPDNPRGWLRRATANRAIDVIRSRKRRNGTWSPRADEARIPAAQGRSEVELDELRSHVAEALGKLTEAQRTVLIAKEFDGQTFTNIAGELGLALPTVKTHYLRALKAVRGSLAVHWKPERSDQ
jgi:RNA polymerase sigma-70 factor (ECF subfamily)